MYTGQNCWNKKGLVGNVKKCPLYIIFEPDSNSDHGKKYRVALVKTV